MVPQRLDVSVPLWGLSLFCWNVKNGTQLFLISSSTKWQWQGRCKYTHNGTQVHVGDNCLFSQACFCVFYLRLAFCNESYSKFFLFQACNSCVFCSVTSRQGTRISKTIALSLYSSLLGSLVIYQETVKPLRDWSICSSKSSIQKMPS